MKDESLKLALEALEGADTIDCDMQEAITALRTALEQQAEPVAIVQTIGHKGGSFDWYAKLGEECCVGDLLYAAPPAQLAAPLTDEQIDELSRTMVKGSKSANWLCRAIEAAIRKGE
jgi:hypothetical protein